ncbi:MAG: DUF2760 domain-containing protein, partial [Gammaproteobacteria bacterium]|nr:DUF2760 domain-containing protein [Gammaproteobacteria bacterium]
MHLDTSIWPTTLDAGHALLAALVFVLLILQVLLLTVTVLALLRRGREAAPA